MALGGAGVSGTVHRPVVRLRGPVRMVLFLRVTVTVVASKVMLQPWSHSWLTERSAPNPRWGKMCAFCAACGRSGRERVAVCVDWIWLPSGRVTVSGRWLVLRSWQVLVLWRKWPVVPLSTMAVSLGVSGGRGGSGASAIGQVMVELVSQLLATAITCHMGGLVCHFASLPPLQLSLVASRWWPSVGHLQVALVWVLPQR